MKRFFLPVVIKTWKTEELAGYSKFLGYTRRYVQRKLNPKFYSFPKWITEDLIRTEKKKKKNNPNLIVILLAWPKRSFRS